MAKTADEPILPPLPANPTPKPLTKKQIENLRAQALQNYAKAHKDATGKFVTWSGKRRRKPAKFTETIAGADLTTWDGILMAHGAILRKINRCKDEDEIKSVQRMKAVIDAAAKALQYRETARRRAAGAGRSSGRPWNPEKILGLKPGLPITFDPNWKRANMLLRGKPKPGRPPKDKEAA